ncbi:serine acetyltransferase [Prosthecobacter sp.]|uniref:serine acetyltransferase n=1 Tax=Prosthecobacter sp. TaxID=1965333 RepID=UPI0037833F85
MMNSLWSVLQADLLRLDGRKGAAAFIAAFVRVPTYRYVALLRLCRHMRQHALLKFSLYPVLLLWLGRLGLKYGIRVPLSCQIGPGFLIEHWGGIWVNPACEIGSQVNLSHGVTLGLAGQGEQRGAPVIGDRVFLGPGCVVLGKIKVGRGAMITANTVVLQDVPENGVVMGNPGRVFSHHGSGGAVKHVNPAEGSGAARDGAAK